MCTCESQSMNQTMNSCSIVMFETESRTRFVVGVKKINIFRQEMENGKTCFVNGTFTFSLSKKRVNLQIGIKLEIKFHLGNCCRE